MESQRVRCLTEGYLRGWLKFEYSLPFSQLREDIILLSIQDNRLYELLHNKLIVETTLRAAVPNQSKNHLDPVFNTLRGLIGLKLPSALPPDKINKDKKEFSESDLAEWKDFLDKVNKK